MSPVTAFTPATLIILIYRLCQTDLHGLVHAACSPCSVFPFSTSILWWCWWCFKAQLKCYLLCETIPCLFPKRFSCPLPFVQCGHCFYNGLSRRWAHLKGLIIYLCLQSQLEAWQRNCSGLLNQQINANLFVIAALEEDNKKSCPTLLSPFSLLNLKILPPNIRSVSTPFAHLLLSGSSPWTFLSVCVWQIGLWFDPNMFLLALGKSFIQRVQGCPLFSSWVWGADLQSSQGCYIQLLAGAP